jgi:hypothetical protein
MPQVGESSSAPDDRPGPGAGAESRGSSSRLTAVAGRHLPRQVSTGREPVFAAPLRISSRGGPLLTRHAGLSGEADMTRTTFRRRFFWLLNNTLNRLTSRMARAGHGPFSLIRQSDANPAARTRHR